MKTVSVLSMLIFTTIMYGQLNRIIPFEFGNPNPANLDFHQGDYFIPAIYFNQADELVSAIIKKNQTHISYYFEDSMAYSIFPMGLSNDYAFTFGKDRSQAKGLKVCLSDLGFNCNKKVELTTPSVQNFPLGSLLYKDNFLLSYRYGETSSTGHNGLALLDTTLNIIWQKDYNLDFKSAYAFDLQKSSDGNIFNSYSFRHHDQLGSFPGITKIDDEGEIIWDSKVEERTYPGANIYHTELSDGNIVLSYQLDRRLDVEFVINDWYIKPTRLLWLTGEGEFIKEKYITGPRNQEILINNVDKGQGDYFFAYGFIEDEDNLQHGLITKYSNEGDTIWSHKYQHPDYRGLGYSYFIKDIVEHDDGSIGVLCSITPAGEKSEIWLFELNEHGCFGNVTECDDYVIVSTLEPNLAEVDDIVLMPNPTADVLNISSSRDLHLASVTIHSLNGEKLLHVTLSSEQRVPVHNLTRGLYIITIQTTDGVVTRKFVKE